MNQAIPQDRCVKASTQKVQTQVVHRRNNPPLKMQVQHLKYYKRSQGLQNQWCGEDVFLAASLNG